MSEDSDYEYFSDGLTEELISVLTRVPGLHVAARTSSFSFKGKNENVTEIGRALNVGAVLEGSVRKAGNKIRITAQLVDCDDGYHLWSESYDREMEDVFQIQDDIACAIVERLKLELLGGHGTPLVRRHTEDLEAYGNYLKGRYVWNRRGAGDLRKSVEYFQLALRADAEYALAYAGLADAYSLLGWYRHLPAKEAFTKTRLAAQSALNLDDSLAEAHTSLAYSRFLYDWDWPGAEEEFKRALELNPGYSTALHWYAEFLMAMGRLDEAHEQLARAQRLDPLSLSIRTGVGWAHYFSGDYRKAIDEYEDILVVNPDFVIIPWFLGPAYVQAGEHDRAIELYEEWTERVEQRRGLRAFLACALAKAGRMDPARRIWMELDGATGSGRITPDNLARVLTGLGNVQGAIDQLYLALQGRCWPLVFLKVEPAYDDLRADPRFKALLKTLGLED